MTFLILPLVFDGLVILVSVSLYRPVARRHSCMSSCHQQRVEDEVERGRHFRGLSSIRYQDSSPVTALTDSFSTHSTQSLTESLAVVIVNPVTDQAVSLSTYQLSLIEAFAVILNPLNPVTGSHSQPTHSSRHSLFHSQPSPWPSPWVKVVARKAAKSELPIPRTPILTMDCNLFSPLSM